MESLLLLVALFASPPDGGEAWIDIRSAANNTALQSLIAPSHRRPRGAGR